MSRLERFGFVALFALGLIPSTLLWLKFFDVNDFMYAATTLLYPDYVLYRDFPFNQTPLHPMAYSLLLAALPFVEPYLAMRSFSFALLVASIVLLVMLVKTRRGTMAAAFFLLANLFSYYTIRIGWETSNYTLAFFFLALAMFLTLREEPSLRTIFLAALCIGLSGSAKISYGVFALPLAMSLWLRRRPTGRELLAYCAGGALGAAPIAYYFLRDPAAFAQLNFGLNGVLGSHTVETANNYPGLVGAAVFYLYRLHVFWLSQAVVVAFIAYGLYRRRTRNLDFELILGAYAVAAFVSAAISIQMFPQHFTPLSIMLLALCASLLFSAAPAAPEDGPGHQPEERPEERRTRRLLFWIVMACIILTNVPKYAVVAGRDWAVSEVDRIAGDIDRLGLSEDCTILTPYGVFLLKTKARIHPVSSMGPFIERDEAMTDRLSWLPRVDRREVDALLLGYRDYNDRLLLKFFGRDEMRSVYVTEFDDRRIELLADPRCLDAPS